jgi:hypothetical protein
LFYTQKDPDLLPYLLFSVFNRGAAVEDTFSSVTFIYILERCWVRKYVRHRHCPGRYFLFCKKFNCMVNYLDSKHQLAKSVSIYEIAPWKKGKKALGQLTDSYDLT